MESRLAGPIRDKAPCMGCTREIKSPGCHDRCRDYWEWKKGVEAANERRKEYKNKSFSRIT